MEIINQSLQDFKLGYASSSEGRDFLYPVLNGIDEYATITQWDNASSLYSITYQTSNDDNFVVTTTAPVLEIGRIGANYHNGDIKSIRFTDQTPLQGISAMAGDGSSRYAPIPEITLAGAFEIEFWWERKDRGANSFAALLGQSDPVNDALLFFDSTHTSAANDFQFRVNDIGYNIAGALAGVAQGQHIHGRVRRLAGDIELFIDDVSKGALLGRTESVTYNQILRFDTTDAGGADTGPLGQLIIRDLETGQVWDYANQNDSGNILRNVNLDTAEGLNIWSGADIIGGTWKRNSDGSFSKISPAQTEIRGNIGELVEGQNYKLRFEATEFTAGVIQLGGATIANNATLLTGVNGEKEVILAAENVSAINAIRINSASATGTIKILELVPLTHGTWYQDGIPMTPSAADAARTDLPLINQEWIFTSPGKIFEAYSGQQATLFGIDTSNWQ